VSRLRSAHKTTDSCVHDNLEPRDIKVLEHLVWRPLTLFNSAPLTEADVIVTRGTSKELSSWPAITPHRAENRQRWR
jgi:hypothetical protein